MINFVDVIKENIKEYNSNCPQVPDHLYRILIIMIIMIILEWYLRLNTSQFMEKCSKY